MLRGIGVSGRGLFGVLVFMASSGWGAGIEGLRRV